MNVSYSEQVGLLSVLEHVTSSGFLTLGDIARTIMTRQQRSGSESVWSCRYLPSDIYCNTAILGIIKLMNLPLNLILNRRLHVTCVDRSTLPILAECIKLYEDIPRPYADSASVRSFPICSLDIVTPIDDDYIPFIRSFKLRELTISAWSRVHGRTTITDKGLSQLDTLRLRRLCVNGGDISTTGLSALSGSVLSTLRLRDMVSQIEFERLADWQSIQELSYSYCGRRYHGFNQSLQELEVFAKLRTLDLSNNRHLDDTGMFEIATRLPNLVKLNIDACRRITDNGIFYVCELNKLQSLSIGYMRLPNTSLARIAKLIHLRELSIRACDFTSIDGIRESNIEAFDMAWNPLQFESDVFDVLEAMPMLTTLNMTGNTFGVRDLLLLSKCPRLKTLYIDSGIDELLRQHIDMQTISVYRADWT